jgi:hypothetical protein
MLSVQIHRGVTAGPGGRQAMPLLLVLFCQSAPFDTPTEITIAELAHLDGVRVGALRTVAAPEGKDGKLLRTTSTLDLTLRRYGSVVRLRREEVTVEAPDGQVQGVSLRQGSPGGRQLVLTGTRDGDSMRVQVDGGKIERTLQWPDGILGLWKQQKYFAERKPKPGERFGFYRYEPTYNAVVTVRGVVTGREAIEVLGAKRTLWRAELTPDRLNVPGHSVQPPKSIWWLDDAYVPVRRQIELDGLGTVILSRTTPEKAAAPAAAAVDIGSRSLLALDRAIPRPFETRSVLYHVTVQAGDDDPESVLVRDGHQEVRNLRGQSFELLVHPVRPGTKGDARPEAEYLGSSHFIDADDAGIKELARRAANGETDLWKKALRIERFVKNLMANDNAAPLVPASQVARSPRGDCRHHAFLTAALCRAEGLPSRTAIGLLYVFRGGPKLGFHTWVEVLIDGQWLGLDSTLGRGGVSAAHVKISDHSWHETASLTPLLPASRVPGKLRVKVLRTE